LSLSGEFIEILKEKGFDDNWDVLSLGCGIGQGELGLKNEQLTGVDIWDYSSSFPYEFIKYDIRKIREIFLPDSLNYRTVLFLTCPSPSSKNQICLLLQLMGTLARVSSW